MKKLSIIVPCYNGSKYISRTLDSLVNQTLNDIEIIVINDGSTDNSLEIINSYKERYPDIINVHNQKNMGIAATRNVGLDLVSGEYFGFLDSDDYTSFDMFEKMYQKAKENDYEVVVSNFTWIYPDGERLEVEGPYKPGKDMMINLFAVLWNKIYKTSFIKKTGIRFPDGNRYEDACFLYCLASNISKIGFVDESFVKYVQVSTSITHTNNDQVKNMITVFNIIYDYYVSTNRFEEYKDELEYIHIKFFLGNSFLRSSLIEDKEDRTNTILLGWDLLNNKFPYWYKNKYIKTLGGFKNRYFSVVRRWNIMIFAWLYRNFYKIRV